MLSTKQIGDIAESACMTRLLMLGYKILIPFGESHDFDLVYHDGKRFIKAQVKKAWYKNNRLCFNGQTRTGRKYKVDVFLVYYQGRIFCFPAKEIDKGCMYVGIDNRTVGQIYAPDYELLPKDKKWLNSIKRG